MRYIILIILFLLPIQALADEDKITIESYRVTIKGQLRMVCDGDKPTKIPVNTGVLWMVTDNRNVVIIFPTMEETPQSKANFDHTHAKFVTSFETKSGHTITEIWKFKYRLSETENRGLDLSILPVKGSKVKTLHYHTKGDQTCTVRGRVKVVNVEFHDVR